MKISVDSGEFEDVTFGTPLSGRERSNSTVPSETSHCRTGLRMGTAELRCVMDTEALQRFSNFDLLLTRNPDGG